MGEGKDGLVAVSRRTLGISSGNTDKVRETMHKSTRVMSDNKKQVLTDQELDEHLNLNQASRENISQYKIQPGSKYETVACKLLEEGNKDRLVADLVSIEMLEDGLNKTVSRTAIQSLIDWLNPIKNIFKLTGQWSDLHKAWVIAWYNFVLHLQVRIDKLYEHESVKKHLKKFNILPDWLNRKKLEEGGYTFSMKQVAWFNKCHVYQKLGPDSPIQF